MISQALPNGRFRIASFEELFSQDHGIMRGQKNNSPRGMLANAFFERFGRPAQGHEHQESHSISLQNTGDRLGFIFSWTTFKIKVKLI